MVMLEEDLQRIVCLHPDLIEPGLTIVEEEFPIRTGNTCYRCDLKGTDRNQETVFVELKTVANLHVVEQISRYRRYSGEKGRYLVAAFYFQPGMKEMLANAGFEAVEISHDRAARLLQREVDNPELYSRRSSIAGNLELKFERGHYLYSDDQKEMVSKFMEKMREGLEIATASIQGIEVKPVDLRKQDQFRLLLSIDCYPHDYLVIYNRARKSNEIHFMYVPDFSFTPQDSTHRKKKWERYIAENKDYIESLFGLTLYPARRARDIKEDHLQYTSQAWKGFSRVYYRTLERWHRPDFLEMMLREFMKFMEMVLPLAGHCFGGLK